MRHGLRRNPRRPRSRADGSARDSDGVPGAGKTVIVRHRSRFGFGVETCGGHDTGERCARGPAGARDRDRVSGGRPGQVILVFAVAAGVIAPQSEGECRWRIPVPVDVPRVVAAELPLYARRPVVNRRRRRRGSSTGDRCLRGRCPDRTGRRTTTIRRLRRENAGACGRITRGVPGQTGSDRRHVAGFRARARACGAPAVLATSNAPSL